MVPRAAIGERLSSRWAFSRSVAYVRMASATRTGSLTSPTICAERALSMNDSIASTIGAAMGFGLAARAFRRAGVTRVVILA